MLNRQSKNIIGNLPTQFNFTADYEKFKQEILQQIKTENAPPFETQILSANGESIPVEINANQIHLGGKDLILCIFRDISDRILAEQKLRESEEKYRLISENANDMIAILNYKFEYEYINMESYFNVLGFSNSDLLGKSVLRFIHPDDLDKKTKTLRKIFEIGEGSGEFRFINKEGNYIWLEIRGTAFTDNKGILKGLIISRDITDKKRAENKLKESEEKYRDLVNRISDLLLEFSSNGKFTYASPQIYDIFGYTFKEIQNKRINKFIHPKDLLKVAEAMKKGFETKKYVTIEYRTLHKEGHYVYSSITGAYMKNGRFYGVVRDISERKITDKLLKDSEKKYKDLIESSPIGILEINLKTMDINYINPKFFKMVGYTLDELNEKDFILSNFDMNDDKVFEFTFYDKNQNLKWLTGAKVYQYDKRGYLESVRIWVKDITERKSLEQKIQMFNTHRS